MDTLKLKEKYEKELKVTEESILVYESSSNNELRIASRTLKIEVESLRIIVDALEKQIPMKAFFEHDDEFICPACNYEEDGYDVKTYNVCPECGQKLKWEE